MKPKLYVYPSVTKLGTAKRLYYLSVIWAVAVVNKVKRAIWKVVVSKEGN